MKSTFLPLKAVFVCSIMLCLLISGCARAADEPNALLRQPDIGVNLEGLADWSRALMFVDAMKTSRAWGRPDKPWVHEVKTDAKGWPLEDAGVVVIADVPHIGGVYHLSFEGKAAVANVACGAKIEHLQYDAANNLSTATITVPDSDTQIMLAFTGTNGGVKNVRLIRPGYDADTTEIFTKPFLEKLAPFSTMRLMDFLNTNNNPVKHWSERTTPDFATQARKQGAALEYVVQLANVTGKDIWVNIPDQADDDYVKQMATLLRDGLSKGQIVYVEWSNEVWNWQFRQATRNLDAAKREGKKAHSPLTFDGSTNEGYWAMRRIAQRSAQVGQIFRDVFNDHNFKRIRPIFATQVGYEEVYKQGFKFLEAQYDRPNKVFYAVAGAPYFQISKELNQKKDLTVDEIFAGIPKNMAASIGYAKTLASYARYYNLHFLAYEGGQHLQDHGDVGNADVKVEANRDPRMGAATEKYLRKWFAAGGELFMYFSLSGGYSKWGSWGLVENITQSSPKYKATLKVLLSPPIPITAGFALPVKIAAGDFASQSHWDKKGSPQVRVEPGKWFQYMVRAPEAGRWHLSLHATNVQNAKVDVSVNSQPQPVDSNAQSVPVNLEAGLNVIRITGKKGRFDLQEMTIEK